MDELYEYNGKQYSLSQLQEKYGDKVNDAIKKLGFKKIEQKQEEVFTYKDKTFTRSQLEQKYGDKTDEAISKFGFESSSKKKNPKSSDGIGTNQDVVSEAKAQGGSLATPQDNQVNNTWDYGNRIEELTNAESKPLPKKPKSTETEKSTYLEEIGRSIKKGMLRVGRDLSATPELLYDIFSIPQNVVSDLTGNDAISANSEKFKEYTGVQNVPKDYYANRLQKEQLISQELDNKYIGGITDNFKKGNISDGFKLLGSSIAESLPATLAIAMSGGTASQSQILVGVTGVFGAGANEDYKDENPEMNANERTVKSFGKGFAEGVFSTIGTSRIGAAAKEILAKEGQKEGGKILKAQLVDMYTELLKKYPIPTAMLGEGLEEAATQMTQNAIDGKDVMEGVSDAFLVGMGSGGSFGVALEGIKKISKDKVSPNDIENIEATKDKTESVKSELEQQVKDGDLTPKEAKDYFDNWEEIKSNLQAVPEDFTPEQKAKAVEVIKEKKAIEKEIEGKEPALVEEKKAKIEELNERLKSIKNTDVKSETPTTETQEQAVETATSDTNSETGEESKGKLNDKAYTTNEGEVFGIEIYDAQHGKVENIEDRKRTDRLSMNMVDKEGKTVGTIGLWKKDDGTWFANLVDVNKEHRRKGIATAMYDYAESKGFKIVDSDKQTEAGKAFKEARNKNKTGQEKGLESNNNQISEVTDTNALEGVENDNGATNQINETNNDEKTQGSNIDANADFQSGIEPSISGKENEVVQPTVEPRASEGEVEIEDQISHAVKEVTKGVLSWGGNPFSPRIDLGGVSRADVRKGESDIKKGKYNTVPAKRVIEALAKAKEQGYYDYMQGSGGKIEKLQVPLTEQLDAEIELSVQELEEINKNEEVLSKQHEDYFSSLDEATQNEILENYENRENNTGEVQSDTEIRESKDDVSDKQEPSPKTEEKIVAKDAKTLYKAHRDLFGTDKAKSLASAVVTDNIIATMAKRAGITKEEMYAKIEFRKGDENTFNKLSKKGESLFQIVGEKANLSNTIKDNLVVARDLETKGKNAESIFLSTGWTKGVDGKWKYDLHEGDVSIKEGVGKITDFVTYPELFKAYPDAKKIQVRIQNNNNSNLYGSFNDDTNVLFINTRKGDAESKLTLLHELQHWVQNKEGFAKGGNEEIARQALDKNIRLAKSTGIKRALLEFKQAISGKKIDTNRLSKSLDKLENLANKDDFDIYQSLAGEVEARNVESRYGMDADVRRNASLDRTEDIANDEKIVLFQKAQGAMLAEDGKYIVYALTDPNISTPLHEMAHVYEHYLEESERKDILDWAKHSEWTTETSELFARGFEKYLADGKAPNSEMQKIFDKFKEWLTDIYNGIKDSDIDIDLSPKMEDLYSKMLGSEKPNQTFERKSGKKSLLNRAHQGGNSKAVTDAIEKHGLDYEIQNQEKAKAKAEQFVDEVGSAVALDAVRNNKIKGAEKAFVYAKIIDNLLNEIESTTNYSEQEILEAEHAKIMADLTAEFDQESRDAGRFISALNNVYHSSKLKYNLTKQIADHKASNNGEISDEVLEKFNEADKRIKELEKKITEAEAKLKEAEDNQSIQNIKEDIERGKKAQSPRQYSLTAKEVSRKKELRGKFFGTLNDVTRIATLVADPEFREYMGLVFKSAKGDFKNFSAQVVKEIGDGAKKHLPQLFKEAQKIHKKSASDKVVIGKEGNIEIPTELFRYYVEQGETDIDVISAFIKEDIKDEFPDADVRDIRDAISGYGKKINPSKDEIRAEMSRLRSLGKLISAYEDASSGKSPLKSGLQRSKPTQEMRELRKKIAQEIKDKGLDAIDPETQWKSALDKVKSHLKNQIEDLDKQIADGEKRKIERNPTKLDQEAESLKKTRDEKRAILDEMVGSPELTEEQRIERAEKSLQTSIDNLQEEISTGKIEYKEKPSVLNSAKLKALRTQRQALIDTKNEMRKQAGLIEEQRLKTAKKRVQGQIDELNRRIKDKDYTKKEPKPLKEDNDLLALRAEKLKQQEVFDAQKYADELKNRSTAQKWLDALSEVWNLPRLLKATGELSTVLIQGGILTVSRKFTNPRELAKIMKILLKSFVSSKYAEQQEALLKAHPNYLLWQKSKLALTNPDYKMETREEQFTGDYANFMWDLPLFLAGFSKKGERIVNEKRTTIGSAILNPLRRITGIGTINNDKVEVGKQWKNINPFKSLERSGSLYMNILRAEEFERGVEMLKMEGKNEIDHIKDYKLVANSINSMSGRANLPFQIASSSKFLAAVFFSARNAVSIMNQMNPIYYGYLQFAGTDGFNTRKITVANKLAMYNMMRFTTITLGMIMAIKFAAGEDEEGEDVVDIETDPRSSDFMKIKIGNIRFDPWHGMSTQAVLMSRLMTEEVKSIRTGEVEKLSEKRFGTQNRLDLLGTYIRNKFSPSMAIAANYASTKLKVDPNTGEEVRYDPFGKKFQDNESLNMTPMYWDALREIQKEDPSAVAQFLTAISFFGWNTGVYASSTSTDKMKKPKKISMPKMPKPPTP